MPEAVGSFSPFLASSSFLAFLGSSPFSFKRVREQLDSQYCAILVAFRRIRQLCYVSGSNRPLPLMYIGLPFSLSAIYLLLVYPSPSHYYTAAATGCPWL